MQSMYLMHMMHMTLIDERDTTGTDSPTQHGVTLPHSPCRGWSVVVGNNFGASVTHKFKSYVFLSNFPGIHVLCWRA